MANKSKRSLRALQLDNDARLAVDRAWKRDKLFGSGDTMDFALFCFEEGRLYGEYCEKKRTGKRGAGNG